jgi:hypothetical protein
MPGENLGTTTIAIPLQKIKPYKPTSTTQAVPETYAGPQSRYDDNYFIDQSKMNSEFFQSMRAENQGFGMELATAGANLIPNIALSIGETAGYLFDVEDWSNMIQGNKTDYGNAITKWASDNKNPFGQVYTKSTDGGFDMSDSAWWVSNGGGLVESLVAFGITGFGVGSVLGKSASMLSKTLGAYGKTKFAIEGAAKLGTSLSLAYSEGAMTGAQVFKDVYDDTYNFEYLKNVNAGMGDKEAKARAHYTATDVAGEGATKAVRTNTLINTFLNIPETNVLFRSMGASRYIDDALKLQKGEFARDAVERIKKFDVNKHLTRQGIEHWGKETGSEMLEEMVNVYAEESGKNVGRLATGQDIVSLGDMLANDDIWAAGFWGAIGGSMNGFVMGKMPKWVVQEDGTKKRTTVGAYNKEQVKDKYKEQLTDLQDRLTEFVDARDALDIAAKSGDERAYKEAADKVFSYNSFNSIVKGTEEQLLNDFQEIAAFTPEQAAQQGFASDYKERATEKIQSVRQNTAEWNKIQDRHSSQDLDQAGFPETIFQQHMNVQNNKKIIQDNTIELAKLESEIAQAHVLRGTDLTTTSFNDVKSSIDAVEHAFEMAAKDLSDIDSLSTLDSKTRQKKIAELSNKYGNIENAKIQIQKHLEELEEKREDLFNNLEIQKENFYSFIDPENTMSDDEKLDRYKNIIAQNSSDIYSLTEGKKVLETNRKILASQIEELRVLKSDKGLERFKALKKEKMAERDALDAQAAAKARAEAEAKAKAAKVEEIKVKKKEAPETVTPQEEEIIQANTPVESFEEGVYSGEGSNKEGLEEQYKEITKIADNSDEEGKVKDSSGQTISVGDKLMYGSNKLAYASTVEYIVEDDKIKHTSLKLNPETNPDLLTDKYVPGTKLKIKKLTPEEFKSHEFFAPDNIKFIDEVGREILVANKGQKVTFEMLSHPYMQPIGIYNEAGEYQAMLHAVTYINDNRVVSENVETDLQTLINIRAAVTNEFQDIKLSSKSNGKLNQLPMFYRLSELIDENVEFAIATSSIQLNTSKVTPVENLANTKGYKVGQVYALTVMPDGRKLAVPVKTTKIKENPQVLTELMSALDIFLKGGNREDLQAVFGKYLHSVFSKDKLTPDGNSFQEDPNGNDRFYIDFTSTNVKGIIFGKAGFSKNFISGDTPIDALEGLKKELASIIQESYINLNFQSLKDPDFVKTYVTSNVRFYPLPNGKVTVFDNPVLGFDPSTLINATAPAAKVTPQPIVTPTTQSSESVFNITIEQIKNNIAELRAKEQAEYAAIDPNDTAARKKIYEDYNKLITTLINEAEADIEKRKEAELELESERIVESTEIWKDEEGRLFRIDKLKNGKQRLAATDEEGKLLSVIDIYEGSVSPTKFIADGEKVKDQEVKENKIVDKINAKYKEELDAVKQVKPTTTPISDIETKKADIETAFDYITTRKYKGENNRLNEINKIGEDLAKRFVATLKEKGLVKEDYRMAPRTDGSVEKMKVNTDDKGNNLGNDWSTAGKFKDEFRKFVNVELASLKSKATTTPTAQSTTDTKAEIEKRLKEEIISLEKDLKAIKFKDGNTLGKMFPDWSVEAATFIREHFKKAVTEEDYNKAVRYENLVNHFDAVVKNELNKLTLQPTAQPTAADIKADIENRIVITGTDQGFEVYNTSNIKNEKAGTVADVRRKYSDDKYEIEFGKGDDKKSIFSDINYGQKEDSYHYFITDKKTKKRYYVVGISSRVTGTDPQRDGSLFATIEDDGNITDFTRTVLELALIKEFENQTKKRKNIFRPLPQKFIDKVKAAEQAALGQAQPTPATETPTTPQEKGEFSIQGTFRGLTHVLGDPANMIPDLRDTGFIDKPTFSESVQKGKKFFTLSIPQADDVYRQGYLSVSLVFPETTTKTMADVKAALEAKVAEAKSVIATARDKGSNAEAFLKNKVSAEYTEQPSVTEPVPVVEQQPVPQPTVELKSAGGAKFNLKLPKEDSDLSITTTEELGVEQVAQEVLPALEDRLRGFLSSINVDTLVVDNLQERLKEKGLNTDAVAISDILHKAIFLDSERYNTMDYAEEVATFAIEFMGASKHAEASPLIRKALDNISSWEKYQQYYDLYKDNPIYKNNERKLKVEILSKLLAEKIIENKDKTKKTKQDKKLTTLETIINDILALFDKIWKSDYYRAVDRFLKQKGIQTKGVNKINIRPFDAVINEIVDDILFNNTSKIINNANRARKGETAVSLKEVLENNPTINEIYNKLNSLGFMFTGSPALSNEGTIYRESNDTLHDLDWQVPKELEDNWLDIIKETFPEIGYKINEKTNQAQIFSKGEKTTHTLMIKGMPVDFFISVNPPSNKNTFGDMRWQDTFEAKMDIGRDKDIRDLIDFKTLFNDYFSNPGYLYYSLGQVKPGKQIEKYVSLQDKVNTLIEEGKATKFCK